MKKVLIVSVFFPPIGGVGVQRITKFVKYLPEFNWEPIVLTIPVWSNKLPKDYNLINEINQNIKIHRPFFFDYKKIIPGEVRKIFKMNKKQSNYPDRYKSWNYYALKRIKKILNTQQINLIMINSSPFSTIELAKALKQESEIPIVLNLRDPFSFNSYTVLNNDKKKMKCAIVFEKEHFYNFSKIICVTPHMQKEYKKLYPEYADKFTLITNGYDESDFIETAESNSKTSNDTFIIGYNGSFSKIVPLNPMLEAIYNLNTRNGMNFKLSITTNISKKKLIALHKKCYEAGFVEYIGFLSHKDSVKRLLHCDLLFVTFADTKATIGAYPVKVLEYLRCNKPIILLNNKTSYLAKLIQDTNTGYCVNIDQPSEIESTLKSLYTEWKKNGMVSYHPNRQEIEKFDFKKLTKKLTESWIS